MSAQCAPQAAFAQIPDSGPNPSASRPAPFSATARAPKSIAYSATALIAAKPLKPCDGGVFRGLNSLSKREWVTQGSGLGLSLSLSLSWVWGWAGLGRAMRPASSLCTNSRQRPQPVRKPSKTGFRNRPHLEIQRLFRYRFDSGKAPKTVRWRRFSWG